VTLGIRPEHFADAGKGDADLTVTIDVAEHLGNTSYIYATTAGGEQLIIERPESRTAGNRDHADRRPFCQTHLPVRQRRQTAALIAHIHPKTKH
jgi:ABC-type sugar transport system ATPase subunit